MVSFDLGLDSLQCLSHIHPDVWDLISSQCDYNRQEHLLYDFSIEDWCEVSHAEEGSQPMEVVGVHMETKHLGDSILHGPLQAKDISQLSQILDGCLSD